MEQAAAAADAVETEINTLPPRPLAHTITHTGMTSTIRHMNRSPHTTTTSITMPTAITHQHIHLHTMMGMVTISIMDFMGITSILFTPHH